MTFDPTITMGNTLTASLIFVGFVAAWVRVESSQKVTSDKLKDVSEQHALEVKETKAQLVKVSELHENEARLNIEHRQQVVESLHQTALLNQATSLTLTAIVKDVNRIDREVEKLRERNKA
jgi:nitrogen-specific signal transduction histidine kinase